MDESILPHKTPLSIHLSKPLRRYQTQIHRSDAASFNSGGSVPFWPQRNSGEKHIWFLNIDVIHLWYHIVLSIFYPKNSGKWGGNCLTPLFLDSKLPSPGFCRDHFKYVASDLRRFSPYFKTTHQPRTFLVKGQFLHEKTTSFRRRGLAEVSIKMWTGQKVHPFQKEISSFHQSHQWSSMASGAVAVSLKLFLNHTFERGKSISQLPFLAGGFNSFEKYESKPNWTSSPN